MRHAARGFGDTKIHDLGHVLARDHDVGRLDVAVNHLPLVRVIQSSSNLFGDFNDLIARNDAFLRHQRLKCVTFQVFHGDVKEAIDFVRVINHHDVGMIHRPRCLGFVAEAAQHLVVIHAVDVEAHGLERYGSSNVGVHCPVDESHGATAQFAYNLVTSNLFHCGHHATYQKRVFPCLCVSALSYRELAGSSRFPAQKGGPERKLQQLTLKVNKMGTGRGY